MIYAVINQKGGVGKTSTALAMLTGLTLRGFKALAIDLDPQGNLTYSTGAHAGGKTALSLLTGEARPEEAIQHTPAGDVIPTSKQLTGADAFIRDTGKEYRLKEALQEIVSTYDYIVIDTPPALGILTVNALTACDRVIIPAQADVYSLQGISQLIDTIRPIKRYTNPALKIGGILLTRYSNRTTLSREVRELIQAKAEELDAYLFEATIREAVAVKESQILRKDLFSYSRAANVAADYQQFIEELLQREGNS